MLPERCFILFILVEASQAFFFLFKKKYDPFDFHQYTDFYGQYRIKEGRKVYTYCFDVRYNAKNFCQPNGSSWTPSTWRPPIHDHGSSHHHHDHDHGGGGGTVHTHHHFHHQNNDYHGSGGGGPILASDQEWNSIIESGRYYRNFDGRNNVRVGSGRVYRNGRTLNIECNFPGNNWLSTDITWMKKSFSGRDYYPRLRNFSNTYGNRRYEVRNLGPSSSALIIRNYDSYEDDGVYRCFAMRSDGSSYGGRQSVYMETEVNSRTIGSGSGGCRTASGIFVC